jgi:hypothetical protein
MTRGWHFTNGVQHYYVGGPNAEAAQALLAERNTDFAKWTSEEIPAALVRFFSLADGKIATARLFGG